MKPYFYFLVFILVFLMGSVEGQQKTCPETMSYENATHYYKGDELWINDTIHYFTGDGDQWQSTHRLVVQSRDGIGQEMETLLEYYETETDSWRGKIKNQQSFYYFENTQLLKETKTLQWNTFHNKWVVLAHKQFDTSGELIKEYSFSWEEEAPIPESGTLTEFTRTREGALVILENQSWDHSTQSWQRKDRISTRKEIKSFTQVEELENWDAKSNQWILASRTTVHTDPAGNLMQKEIRHYDKSGKSSVLTSTLKNIYDRNGHLRETIQVKDWGYKKTGVREQHLYETNGALVKSTRFVLNATGMDWEPSEQKHIYYAQDQKTLLYRTWLTVEEEWGDRLMETERYDEGFLVEKQISRWNPGNSIWQPETVEYYSYLGQNLVEKHTMTWDAHKKEWTNESLIETDFNRFGKTTEIKYVWSVEMREWNPVFRHNWQYDDSGNITGFEWMHSVEGEWQLKERAEFGWHMFALTKTECLDSYTIEVFPNPTKGVLHIKSTAGTLLRIAILDQSGQLLEATSLDQTSTTIDISHLPSGNYFIECFTDIRTNTFKVVKL